jgi:hypothetical protein
MKAKKQMGAVTDPLLLKLFEAASSQEFRYVKASWARAMVVDRSRIDRADEAVELPVTGFIAAGSML